MKKLIAAAVAAAVIAPASVMAAGPTLYGKIHMAVENHDNNGSNALLGTPGFEAENTKYDEWNLSSRSSRIGVKGSEDLGNGMKVGYLIEWEVGMDSGSSNDLSTRNRAVTLSGDWGTALLGKWDTPFKTLGRKFDMFGDRIGDLRNMNTGAVIDQRAENVAAYVTPNMNGFTATIAYSFDALSTGLDDDGVSRGGDNSDSSAWTFNAIYNNGPLMAGIGYVDYSTGSFSVSNGSPATVIVDPVTGLPATKPAVASTSCFQSSTVNNCENEKAWRAGASYKFGDFKVAATYTDISNASGMDGKDTSIWSLGGSYTMGNNIIKVQYASRDEYDDWKNATGAKVTNSGQDTGADMWVIGLDHKMSKRTTVYAAYATMDNDKNSAGTSWSQGNSSSNGSAGVNSQGNAQDADSFAVGIIHKF